MARIRCFACGRFADEVEDGPTADEAGQTERFAAGVLDVHDKGPCRAAVACWSCFWKTDPDQWILPAHWDALAPLVPSHQLPLIGDHGRPGVWDPASYPWPLALVEGPDKPGGDA